MKNKIYRGWIIINNDEQYFEGINTNDDQLFVQTGEWVSGTRTVGSYALCDCYGEVIDEFEHLQFSRTMDNRFYLESVG